MSVLLADMGATNARFCILNKGRVSDVYQYACDDFKNPYQMIESFICLYGTDVQYILMGVPGVVLNNSVHWTNRKWTLDGNELKKKLKLKKAVMHNDLKVQGYAIPYLKGKDIVCLNKKKANKGPKILMNVGTGLGACFLIENKVFSAEYGQNMMIDGNTIESMVSGPAFKRLYQTLSGTDTMTSALIIADKCQKSEAIAKKTYQQFYGRLARVVMNLALTIQATGGVYIGGGILDEKTLKQMEFAKLFCNHPKMKRILDEMPLYYIKNKDFAFIGLKALAKEYGWS